jgi:UDP-N-acetylmuramate dehydrogenase
MFSSFTSDTYSQQLAQLVEAGVGRALFDAPLAEHNSWHIGGPADLLVEPETIAQVARVVSFARFHDIPLLVIGQGTNLLNLGLLFHFG